MDYFSHFYVRKFVPFGKTDYDARDIPYFKSYMDQLVYFNLQLLSIQSS